MKAVNKAAPEIHAARRRTKCLEIFISQEVVCYQIFEKETPLFMRFTVVIHIIINFHDEWISEHRRFSFSFQALPVEYQKMRERNFPARNWWNIFDIFFCSVCFQLSYRRHLSRIKSVFLHFNTRETTTKDILLQVDERKRKITQLNNVMWKRIWIASCFRFAEVIFLSRRCSFMRTGGILYNKLNICNHYPGG